jgi:hypothetical protein
MKDQLYEPAPESAPVRKHIEPGGPPKWALPTEVFVGGALLIGVVIIGSRMADLVLTLMLCGVAYAAGRWRR